METEERNQTPCVPSEIIVDAIICLVGARIRAMRAASALKEMTDYTGAEEELEDAIDHIYSAESALGNANLYTITAMAAEEEEM